MTTRYDLADIASALDKLADAAKTVANAYACKVEHETTQEYHVVVNVNSDGVHSTDIARVVGNALRARKGGVQDSV